MRNKFEQLIEYVINDEEVEEVFAVLRKKEARMPTNWSRRFKNHSEKLRSGDIYQVAEVVRNLSIRDKDKGLSAREVHSRYEIMVETYNKVVNVEAQLTVLMANRYVLPAALEYQRQVAQSVAAVKAAGSKSVEGKKLLDQIVKMTDGLKKAIDKLEATLEHESNSADKHAKHFRDAVIPAMSALRAASDALECVIPHEVWPLATYREMLFIK